MPPTKSIGANAAMVVSTPNVAGVIQRVPLGADLRVDAFADDDRVIDDDTEHENKAEQADDVNGDRPRAERHEPHRAEKRDRNTDGHPDGDLQSKKQRQDEEYERRSLQHVLHHHLNAFRQGGRFAFNVLLYGRGCCQLVLLPPRQHPEYRRFLTVEAAIALSLDEAVLYRRDTAERQARAVRKCAQHELPELRSRIDLTFGP
jgi:hypothetical protein